MNQRAAIGLLTAVTGVALLVFVLSHGTHFPAYRWPGEAFQGLAFFFAWGLGVSPVLAYLLAALTLAAVFIEMREKPRTFSVRMNSAGRASGPRPREDGAAVRYIP